MLQYRPKGSDRKASPKLVTIGQHGAITADQARQIAVDLRGRIASGGDPARDLSWKRESATMVELADLYLADMKGRGKKPKGIADAEQVIRFYINPKLGSLKVIDVTRADVVAAAKAAPAIAVRNATIKGKVRRGVDGSRTAGRVVRTLKAMFNRAMLNEAPWFQMRPPGTNPCLKVELNTGRKRKRVPKLSEIRAVMRALAEMHRDGENPWAVSLFVLLILTGARLREIMEAKRAWVDREAGILALPDSKTGAKEIPLSPFALAVIDTTPELTSNPYLICGDTPGRPMVNPYSFWRRVIEQAGVTDLTPHDWRRAYASVGLSGGLTLEKIGGLLGHSQVATTKSYAFLMPDARQEAATLIGERLLSLLSGEELPALVAHALSTGTAEP